MAKKPYIKKKRDISSYFVAIFLSLIFGLSTIAFILTFVPIGNNNGEISFEYNRTKIYFDPQNNFYYVKGEANYKFLEVPETAMSLDNSSLILDLLRSNPNKAVVVSFPPDLPLDSQTYLDYLRFFYETQFPERLGSAILEESENFNLPVVNCSSNDGTFIIVELRESNETKVFVNDSCAVVEGNVNDFNKIYALVAYYFSGVLQ